MLNCIYTLLPSLLFQATLTTTRSFIPHYLPAVLPPPRNSSDFANTCWRALLILIWTITSLCEAPVVATVPPVDWGISSHASNAKKCSRRPMDWRYTQGGLIMGRDRMLVSCAIRRLVLKSAWVNTGELLFILLSDFNELVDTYFIIIFCSYAAKIRNY